jgi:hypothetical protein
MQTLVVTIHIGGHLWWHIVTTILHAAHAKVICLSSHYWALVVAHGDNNSACGACKPWLSQYTLVGTFGGTLSPTLCMRRMQTPVHTYAEHDLLFVCRICGVPVCLRVYQRLSFISAKRVTTMRARVLAGVHWQSQNVLRITASSHASCSDVCTSSTHSRQGLQLDIRMFFKPIY